MRPKVVKRFPIPKTSPKTLVSDILVDNFKNLTRHQLKLSNFDLIWGTFVGMWKLKVRKIPNSAPHPSEVIFKAWDKLMKCSSTL